MRCRYGRDYYINEAKKASGERERRLAMANAGRPNSSLSQYSGSFDDDLEPQVSYGLDRFEEASLRGSLRRRSFRGQNSSPHFVINPLLHLQVIQDSKVVKVDDTSESCVSDTVRNESRNTANSVNRKPEIIGPYSKTTGSREELISNDNSKSKYLVNPLNVCYYLGGEDDEKLINEENEAAEVSAEFSEKLASMSDLIYEGNDRKLKVIDGEGKEVDLVPETFEKLFKIGDRTENFAVNPLFDMKNDFSRPDQNQNSNLMDLDSGMYSIGSNDLVESRKNMILRSEEAEVPRRLSVDSDSKRFSKSHVISSNGKRYSDFGNFKFHTFGGIKRRRFNWKDFEEEKDDTDSDNEGLSEYPDNASDFGSMKCQTFGGIKQRAKFDSKNIGKYEKVKLRSPLLFKDVKAAKNEPRIKSENGKDTLYSNFETRRDPNYCTKFKDARSNMSGDRGKKKKLLQETNWKESYDESYFGDRDLMANFLRDALMRPKSRLSTDNESVYSVAGAKRKSKILREATRRPSEPCSLRLEPPVQPEVVLTSYETLAGLRRSKSLKSNASSLRSISSIRKRIPHDISMW